MNTDFFGPSAERNSWFGGLNAGVKCVVTVVLILAAILIKDPVSATVMLVLELVGFTVVGFRPVNLLARAWPILVAVASTGWSVAILVNKAGPVILDFGVNSITQGSLAAAVSMMLRSLAMVLPTFAFVLSTDPTDLGDSLAQTFRLPARFVLAALAALRLVGILFGEWNTLGQARRARGLGAGQGGHHGGARVRCGGAVVGACARLFASGCVPGGGLSGDCCARVWGVVVAGRPAVPVGVAGIEYTW